MPNRNVFALTALITIILTLTVIIGGRGAQPPRLGWLAPFLILALMTWYLILLVTNRNEIIAGVAAMFKMSRNRDLVRPTFWSTLVSCVVILLLGIVILWARVPQRILEGIQALSLPSGISTPPQQLNPISGIFLPTAVSYYGRFIFVGIFVLSFILLIAGVRLALSDRMIHPKDSRLGIEEEAAEIVQQTIAALKSERKNEYHEIILQCYQRMCEILSSEGKKVEPTETAREFAKNISTELKVGATAVSGLTFLFEEARYSNHEISETKRKMAIDYLGSLQRALSANRGMST